MKSRYPHRRSDVRQAGLPVLARLVRPCRGGHADTLQLRQPRLPRGLAQWQKECADLWAPILERHHVGLVVAGHTHRYRFDPPEPGRPWAQLVCGGAGAGTFQTLAVCEVEDGELVVRVHDTDAGNIVAIHRFSPR